MAESEHGRIIAAQARLALAPIGFQQRGRSRVWLADHGYWLGVIEFQPSGFSKGSYCNVGVHWLWGLTPAVIFDFDAHRVGSFASFNDPEAFAENVAGMAHAAAQSAKRHREMFSSLPATAAILAKDENAQADPGCWPAFHAGVGCGLARDTETAGLMFERVRAANVRNVDWLKERRLKVERLMVVLSDHVAFRTEVQSQVDDHRARLKLGPYALGT
jgi:hypothetical protein